MELGFSGEENDCEYSAIDTYAASEHSNYNYKRLGRAMRNDSNGWAAVVHFSHFSNTVQPSFRLCVIVS